MQSASYYLLQAQKAERLAHLLTDERGKADLAKMAQDYRDIAEIWRTARSTSATRNGCRN
jgi:hypothetical protein